MHIIFKQNFARWCVPFSLHGNFWFCCMGKRAWIHRCWVQMRCDRHKSWFDCVLDATATRQGRPRKCPRELFEKFVCPCETKLRTCKPCICQTSGVCNPQILGCFPWFKSTIEVFHSKAGQQTNIDIPKFSSEWLILCFCSNTTSLDTPGINAQLIDWVTLLHPGPPINNRWLIRARKPRSCVWILRVESHDQCSTSKQKVVYKLLSTGWKLQHRSLQHKWGWSGLHSLNLALSNLNPVPMFWSPKGPNRAHWDQRKDVCAQFVERVWHSFGT